MIRHIQSKKIGSELENPLDRALIAFMHKHGGQWIGRDRVMFCYGYENPEKQPFLAFVEFYNSLNRVNQVLHKNGLEIIRRGERKDEELFLGSAEGQG